MAIGGAQAFIAGIARDLEFALLDEQLRLRKRGLDVPDSRLRTIPPQ